MPAGSSYDKTTPCARTSIQEQCVELQRKLQLLDGGRKAMYESAQITTRRNKEQIALLRQQVKSLREHLAGAMAGDEEVIKSAFKNRYSDGAGMKRKTGKAAITAVDEKVCDSRKKLNALIHMSAVKKKKLNELQTRYREMQREVKDISAAEKIESKDTTKLKEVENRQDKIQLKLQEAERIQRTYQQIQSCLEQESLTYAKDTAEVETDIKKQQDEIDSMIFMLKDAQESADMAKAKLTRKDDGLVRQHKEWHIELMQVRKLAAEKKAHFERIEKRIQQSSLTQQQNSMLKQERQSVESTVEQELQIVTFEDAMAKIKQATGVSDMQEVVVRFTCQDHTQSHLQMLKEDARSKIAELAERRCELDTKCKTLKFSTENQVTSGDRITTEFREHLSAEIVRRDKTVRQTEEALILFVAIKSGIENLTEKLQLVESPEDAEEKLDRCSVDYPVQLLGSCRDKLARVLVDISEGEEQAMGEREMQEELVKTLESSVPHSVSRAKLLTAVPSTAFNDDDDSGEEVEVLTRAAIKKQAQVLASMKVKKGGRTPRRQR